MSKGILKSLVRDRYSGTVILLPFLAVLTGRSSGGDRRLGALFLGRVVTLLVALLVEFLRFLFVLPLGIPLTSLENQHTDQDEGENGVASSENFEAIFPTKNLFGVLFGWGQVDTVPSASNETKSLDNIGNVNSHTTDIENQARAIKEHVRLGRFVQLCNHAGKPDEDDDMQYTWNQRWRSVEEAQVSFEVVIVRGRRGLPSPEQRIVIREKREDDSQEETRRYKRRERLATSHRIEHMWEQAIKTDMA